MKNLNNAPGFAIGMACILGFTTAIFLSGCAGVSSNGKGGFNITAADPHPIGEAAGHRVNVPRDLKDFHAIDSNAVCEMEINDGQPFSVIVSASDEDDAKIKTEVKGGILTIKEDRNLDSGKKVKITINMPKLDKLTVSGVGATQINGIKESFLTVELSGTGSCSGNGSADMFDLKLSGVGSGRFDALTAKAATVLLSGTGSGNVRATESLTATVSGIGSLTYAGNPPKVQKNVTGIGKISAQ